MPLKYTPEQQIERFWNKLDRSGNCWIWTGCVRPNGYGLSLFEGKNQGTHRIAWQIVNGVIPAGMLICHHCDVRLCCRPDHLFLGTQKENMQDCKTKGRFVQNPLPRFYGDSNVSRQHPELLPHGEAHHSAKLTESGVQAIRFRHTQGTSMGKLAREYGVSVQTVSRVIHRTLWRHID